MKQKIIMILIISPLFYGCQNQSNNSEQTYTKETTNVKIKEAEKKHLDLAAAKDESGDLIGAIAEYSKAIDINPENPETYFKRGCDKSYLEDNAGAIIDYDRVIQLKPDFWDVYFNRGFSEEALGKYMDAMKDYTKSIENGNGLGYFHRGCLKEILEDYRGAIEDFDIQIKGSPKHFPTYEHRGKAKMKLGDSKGAFQDWNKAGELGSSNSYNLIKQHCN